MNLGLTLQGYNDFSRNIIANPEQIKPITQHSSDVVKYSELTSLAFSGQIAQIKKETPQPNLLEEQKAYPIDGVEYAKEWPLDQKSIKVMHQRFKNAQAFNNIEENYKFWIISWKVPKKTV